MEKNNDYFDNKSEAEKLRNVASLVNDIVNVKPEEPAEVKEAETTDEVDPIVDLVGKAISTHKPNRGAFFQGVQTDDNPKL
tara:strand:+ start:301 stop:543 length:243 start_codon:yes stop_codon:yes gene_type:complete